MNRPPWLWQPLLLTALVAAAACGTGPVLWCDDNLVENLSEEKLEKFLDGLK